VSLAGSGSGTNSPGTSNTAVSARRRTKKSQFHAVSFTPSGFDDVQVADDIRRYDHPGLGLNAVATSDDELFARTGHAALTMAGRSEFAASHALLKQARSLLPAT
jgi:hypothetical protein